MLRPGLALSVLALAAVAACSGGSGAVGSVGGATAGGLTAGTSTGGACSKASGSGSLESCLLASDCLCPNSCVADPGVVQPGGSDGGELLCEQTGCKQTSDCSDPSTICESGNCALNFCVVDLAGNLKPGTLGEPCTADGIGSGTCLAESTSWGICVQGGTAAPGSPCLQQANPSTQADLLCAVGSFCGSVGDGGLCFATGKGGCIRDQEFSNTEIYSCNGSIGCECDAICRTDDAVSGAVQLCESTCTTDRDCPSALEVCAPKTGYCSIDFCAFDTAGRSLPGTVGGDCAPMDAGAGCLFTDLYGSFGACILFGDAGPGSPCDPYLGRANPALLCSEGAVCWVGALDDGAVCVNLCDPGNDAGCRANEGCLDYTGGQVPNAGVCCLPPKARCSVSQACCDQACLDGVCL